jgi:membrane peptidoglycan carboxypeptidase
MIRRFSPASIVVTLAISMIAFELALTLIPIPSALLRPPVQSISLLDRTGIPLREARVAERFSREVALADIPPHVIDAILAAED